VVILSGAKDPSAAQMGSAVSRPFNLLDQHI